MAELLDVLSPPSNLIKVLLRFPLGNESQLMYMFLQFSTLGS